MDTKVPSESPMDIDPPYEFIRDVFTCSEALAFAKDSPINPLGWFMKLRGLVHSLLLNSALGTALVIPIELLIEGSEKVFGSSIMNYCDIVEQASACLKDTDSAEQCEERYLDVFKAIEEKKFYVK